jgi:hypothetical protein
MQLWRTVSTSNIDILERFQPKALRMIVDAWYVPNTAILRDLQIPTVKAFDTVLASAHTQTTSWSYRTRGDCEDTCQMICLPDS